MGSGTRRITDAMSRKISHLMFILSVFVVYIHFVDYSYAALSEYYVEHNIEYFISNVICRTAVPLFFVISGYLVFSKINVSPKSLLAAYKTKVTTLLVPYLFWSAFYLLVFIVLKAYTNSLGEVTNWTSEIFRGLFLYGKNVVLWYVFQLIILTVLAPLLYYIYKNKYISVIFSISACIAYFCVPNPPIWLPLYGLAFYSVGGTLAMHFQKGIDSDFWTPKKRSLVSFATLAVFVVFCVLRMTMLDTLDPISEVRATPLCRLMEAVLAFSLWFAIDLLRLETKNVRSFEQCSFLIYVTHTFAITVVTKLLEYLPLSMTPILCLAIYLVMPLVMVAVIALVARFLKKILPKFYALISGGR